MRLIDRRTGIELLERAECLERLAADVVGRLAIVVGGSPVVMPVNYAMDGESVVFRTAPGTKLDAAGRGDACFEIDGFDRSNRTGWSVAVTGRLEEVTAHDAALLDRVSRLPVDPWADGDRNHVVRLVPHVISGRRVGTLTDAQRK
jgi:uncharacterized protein